MNAKIPINNDTELIGHFFMGSPEFILLAEYHKNGIRANGDNPGGQPPAGGFFFESGRGAGSFFFRNGKTSFFSGFIRSIRAWRRVFLN
jgi:hypothetical protein